MSAVFSECGKYRYKLSRTWAYTGTRASVIMLNPSTADESTDDATIRNLTKLLKNNGMSGMDVYNLWAIISTDPDILKRISAEDARGNNAKYLEEISMSTCIIFAWGNPGQLGNSDTERWNDYAMCFGKNKTGSPKHPLYLKGDTKLVNW